MSNLDAIILTVDDDDLSDAAAAELVELRAWKANAERVILAAVPFADRNYTKYAVAQAELRAALAPFQPRDEPGQEGETEEAAE